MARIHKLEELLQIDPIAAREELRRAFKGGKIGLHLTPEGVFAVRTELLGEIFLLETRTPAEGQCLGRELNVGGSGGRI